MTFYQKFINKDIKYKEYDFAKRKARRNCEYINKEIAKENLLLFKKIAEEVDLKFFLIYGTLLGFIRDNDFIDYDTDTDIGIFENDREKLEKIVPKLLSNGFEIIRNYKSPFDDKDDLVTFMRKDEYIDVGIFNLRGGMYIYQNNKIPKKFLEKLDIIKIFDTNFYIPYYYEKSLNYCYGNWRIRRKNEPANPFFARIYYRFARWSKDKFIGKILRKIKRMING